MTTPAASISPSRLPPELMTAILDIYIADAIASTPKPLQPSRYRRLLTTLHITTKPPHPTRVLLANAILASKSLAYIVFRRLYILFSKKFIPMLSANLAEYRRFLSGLRSTVPSARKWEKKSAKVQLRWRRAAIEVQWEMLSRLLGLCDVIVAAVGVAGREVMVVRCRCGDIVRAWSVLRNVKIV